MEKALDHACRAMPSGHVDLIYRDVYVFGGDVKIPDLHEKN